MANLKKKGISFPHRESASWNFPAKIKNSLLPVNIFHLISKNPGLTFSPRRRYVDKIMPNADLFVSERKKE